MILTSDLHLTDNPDEDYRWGIFDELRAAFDEMGPCGIVIAGDLCDRKDRHSAALVNRLVEALTGLYRHMQDAPRDDGSFFEVDIIMGNHDEPLKGAPFWSFFEHIEGVNFHVQPAELSPDVLLLPFTSNPAEAWEDLDLGSYRCVILHQPVDGARGENGRSISGSPMPVLPKGPRFYAGDIHTPQRVGRIRYIGAPHPIKFGDAYECRILFLDDNYREHPVHLEPMRRHMLDIQVVGQLQDIEVIPGDQAKVRFQLILSDMHRWPLNKAAIEEWARRNDVRLFSIEPVVQMDTIASGKKAGEILVSDPESTLMAFCEEEGVGEVMYSVGDDLLTAVLKEGAE